MRKKLNGRDFITIGIFNAISIVIYMAVAFALATTVIGGFIASGIAFMVVAIVYLLMGVKIKKMGVFTISGILLGLFALSGGHMPHAIFSSLGGVVCDIIIGNYESKGRIILGYGVFALSDFLGTVLPILLFGTVSFVERAAKWKMTEAQIKRAVSYFSVPYTICFGSFTFVLACVGAFVAIKFLNKHFKKAGAI